MLLLVNIIVKIIYVIINVATNSYSKVHLKPFQTSMND